VGTKCAVPAEAADGDEAIALVSAGRPDAVLLDVCMPRRTGLDRASRATGLRVD
jgi:YesN/AraC family two-component response regulator